MHILFFPGYVLDNFSLILYALMSSLSGVITINLFEKIHCGRFNCYGLYAYFDSFVDHLLEGLYFLDLKNKNYVSLKHFTSVKLNCGVLLDR